MRENEFADDEIEDVPVSALLHEDRRNKYGPVPGLEDEEPADPAELERQVMLQEWGPILALPNRHEPRGVRPAIDEEGRVDWGAYGTADFERIRPSFDKARYKADKLKDELEDVLIMLSIVGRRLAGRAKYQVLRYVQMGVIVEEHIVSEDMRAWARLCLRAKRLQRQIAELREVSREKLRQEMAWLLS
jgi:hypothetical protein